MSVKSLFYQEENKIEEYNDRYLNHTSVHTKVNSQFRISSIWREYSNPYFQQWAWETIVWKRADDKESIDYQASNLTIEETLSLHKWLYERILSELPYEDDEETD